MPDKSVTHWLNELERGDSATAQQELWNRYFHRLIGLARSKLGAVRRQAEDEEDVAICALNSFFDRAMRGEFPLLTDRTNLWPLLAKITARKAINQREKALARKHGGGILRGESVFARGQSGDERQCGIEAIVGDEPTPQFAAEMAEQCRELLNQLPDDLRLVASRRLYGYSNAEIAAELGCVTRTVDRKLERIRAIWSAHCSAVE